MGSTRNAEIEALDAQKTPFVQSGCPVLVDMKILGAIYSLLLIRIWDGEYGGRARLRHNNVIHKSSPTPLLTKHANELITLSQLMNLVARVSVAHSIRR